jgi:hypothetical protein
VLQIEFLLPQLSCLAGHSLARLLVVQNQFHFSNIFLPWVKVRFGLVLSYADWRIQFQQPERFGLVAFVNVFIVGWPGEGFPPQSAME